MKLKSILLTAVTTLSLVTLTMAQVPNYVPTNGLVGWWPFNGNANDESGNGNNGAVNGATLTADRNGNANSSYAFDNTDNISIAHNNIFNAPQITISLWYNVPQYSTQVLISKRENNGWGSSFELNLVVVNSQNAIQTSCSVGGNSVLSYENPSILNNQWYNYTMVYRSDSVFLYLNSYLVKGTAVSGGMNSNTLPITIGSRGNGWHQTIGKIDDIGIWNRALTQQEISDLYNGCQLSVNTQPTNQAINVNNNAQFVVNSSDPNATFQWQTDLGAGFQNLNSVAQYSGTMNDTLTVANVTMTNNNQSFRCIVNSGSCSDTSIVALLNVNSNFGTCINEYLKFDGSDDWIDISNNGPMSNIQNNTSYTIEAWTKRAHATFPGGLERIYSKDYIFNFRVVNDQFSGEVGNSSVTFPYPTDTIWHHIAFVRNITQAQLQLFIDGNLVNSTIDNSSTISNNNAMVCIGARNNGIGIYEEWKGGLKLIRVSNTNRYSNSFIPNVNYTSDINTLGFWPLNEGSGNTANDLSNSLNSGSINNAVWMTENTTSPLIVQPISQSLNINNTAQFIVGASAPNATFQWQTDLGVGFQNLNSVGQYSGTTNDTLTVSYVMMSNNNQPFRCIVNSGSCSDTSSVALLTVNNTVGISENSKNNLFTVFPNPTQSIVNIKADINLIGEIYSIHDNTGRVVLTGKLNAQNTTIELGNLSGGIYMCRVGDNMKQQFKILKQ